MAAGLVTIYQREGTLSQIVGQDRIAFVPPNGEFSVSQGLSATLFGTRRVLERRVVNYRDNKETNRERLVTRVEVVLTNRGSQPAEAFVREGIERYEGNQWKIVDSPTPNERLGVNTVQFKVAVPAGGKTTIVYTAECECSSTKHGYAIDCDDWGDERLYRLDSSSCLTSLQTSPCRRTSDHFPHRNSKH